MAGYFSRIGLIACFATGLISQGVSANEPAEIMVEPAYSIAEPLIQAASDDNKYLTTLKNLYLTNDNRQALTLHINDLLASYSLRAGYQLNQANPASVTYSLAYTEDRQLSIRRQQTFVNEKATKVSTQRMPIFGLDPNIKYDCPSHTVSCEFFLADSTTPLFSIVRNQNAAAEISKALTALIRNLQKN